MRRAARISIIQTGDELVPAGHNPVSAQIRNSNGPLLCALATAQGATVIDEGIVRDDRTDLEAAMARGLHSDMLLISGGVSMGVRDLVPQVLNDLGVTCHFHRVAIKPGKPLWFGTQRTGDRTTLVFGLPGNPVSGLVGFLVFVAPLLADQGVMISTRAGQPAPHRVVLQDPFTPKGALTTFWPARLESPQLDDDSAWAVQETTLRATPLPWRGSADPFTLSHADGLLEFPPREGTYAAGELIRWWPLS